MANLSIVSVPHPVLRKPAASVARITDIERKMLSDMAETMYLSGGVGLAATQVGIDKQMAVIDIGDGIMTLINPAIVERQGMESKDEGCLSAPHVTVRVKRAKTVVVDYLDMYGDVKRIKATGLLARVIQHEIDHLNGKVIIDHLSPIKRIFAARSRRKA